MVSDLNLTQSLSILKLDIWFALSSSSRPWEIFRNMVIFTVESCQHLAKPPS
jgi:hypothetical protein